MSTWKAIIELHNRVSGAWKEISNGYYRVSGAWKKVFGPDIPANMIVLFKAVPGSPWTVVSSPTLDDKYGKCHTAQGSSGGVNTHTHASSGFTTGYASGSYLRLSGIYDRMINRAHTHTFTHGHTVVTNHEPEWYGLCPAIGGFPIPTTGYIFYDGFVDPDGWVSDTDLHNKYIKFKTSSPGGSGGNATHSHAITLASSSTLSQTRRASLGNACQRSNDVSHNHTASHTHVDSNNLAYYTLRPIHPALETSIIPSGAIAFFVGSAVPSGWTQLAAANDKFIKMMTYSGAAGGALTHTMSHPWNTSTRSTSSLNVRAGSTFYAISGTGHYHAMGSVNHIAASLEPEYQQLLICKKD